MKRKRLSVEQIVGILNQAEVGAPAAEVIRNRNGTEADLPRSNPRSEVIVHDSDPKPVRNVRLGVLFVWTACISTVLWGCSLLQLGTTYSGADLAHLPIYCALASAGFSLMWRRAVDRVSTHYD